MTLVAFIILFYLEIKFVILLSLRVYLLPSLTWNSKGKSSSDSLNHTHLMFLLCSLQPLSKLNELIFLIFREIFSSLTLLISLLYPAWLAVNKLGTIFKAMHAFSESTMQTS